MVSNMFMRDYRRMTAEGVKLTPEDIIRLNALAVKVRRSNDCFADVHLRRAVFLDGLTLMQPTIGHELWLERVGQYLDFDQGQNFRVAYCYALSHSDANSLPNPLHYRWTLWRMFRWARLNLARLTSEMVGDAIDYVLFGADWTVDENPPPRNDTPVDKSSYVGVVLAGVARRLPLSLADAKRLTPSQLLAAIRAARCIDGDGDLDAGRNSALGDYFRAMNEVKSRAEREAKGEHT